MKILALAAWAACLSTAALAADTAMTKADQQALLDSGVGNVASCTQVPVSKEEQALNETHKALGEPMLTCWKCVGDLKPRCVPPAQALKQSVPAPKRMRELPPFWIEEGA